MTDVTSHLFGLIWEDREKNERQDRFDTTISTMYFYEIRASIIAPSATFPAYVLRASLYSKGLTLRRGSYVYDRPTFKRSEMASVKPLGCEEHLGTLNCITHWPEAK
jgi:hypothetical protein